MTTAVVVSGGGLQGLAVVKSLRRVPGLRVLVADCHDDHLARFVAHGSLRAPLLADEARFEEFLVTLCRRESVQHVFPATSFELSTLLRLKPLLSHEGVTTWVSSAEVLALGADKSHLYRWLAAQGFPVLPSLPLPDDASAHRRTTEQARPPGRRRSRAKNQCDKHDPFPGNS